MSKYNNHIRKLTLSTLSLSLLALSSSVHAAGFGLMEQNASGLGNAYAGSVAIADNASTIFFNPAGMSRLPGLQISIGGALVKPGFKFKNNGQSTLPGYFSAPGSLAPIQLGGNGGDAGTIGFLPNAYISYQLNDRIHLGLGLGAPFGLKTEYDDDWLGRYHSRSFDIKTYNINPSMSFKVNEQFSIGAGLNIQHINATYQKSVPVPIPVAPGVIRFADGEAEAKLKKTALGWNIGFLYEPVPDTRFGFSYRSRLKHKATGDTEVVFNVPGRGQQTLSSESSATVSLPDMAILSAYHRLNERWEIMGDISWTGWSSIPELAIKNNAPLQDTTLDLRFKDSWRIALGANYQLNPAWKLKAGVAWDQSPVRKASHRPASLPDNERWWFSVGAQYKPSENTAIDLGYTYLYIPSAKVDNTNGGNLAQYGRLAGKYTGNGHILGVQVSHRF
ncbi:OmpP1/FadL family transporter [Advenella sp. RU8]|uniref:OmpP1/FadL family transporter n=1 Tax=Advenella sp. RU8 TaxID=3399575 RepID=UPI003AACD415